MAHVTGIVELRFTVTSEGDVKDITPMSGPSMLQQEAIYSVRLWKYRPYLVNGAPKPFMTSTSIDFKKISPLRRPPVEKSTRVLDKVGPVQEKCLKLLHAQDAAAVEPCRERAELFDQVPNGILVQTKIRVHDEYGFVLLAYAHRAQDAVAQFEIEKALLPEIMTPASLDYAVAYWHLGAAHMDLGQFAQAEEAFSIAEDSATQAGQFIPANAAACRAMRVKIAGMHADLLKKEGKPDEAQKLLDANQPQREL
jgi:tetratricopeptide (TPR) repeat protein